MTSGLADQDLARWLARLEREIERLPAVVASAQQPRDPAIAGTDPSGAVIVSLSPDGAASDVRIAADWRRRLRPEDVGDAVVAADSEAAQRLAHAVAHATTASAGPTVLDPIAPVGPTGQPCSPAALAERAIATFDDAAFDDAAFDDAALDDATFASDDVASQGGAALTAVGTGAESAVSLCLSQGRIAACEVDRVWLNQQDEITLAHALREALADATARHAEACQPSEALADRIADLLADVKATLREISGAR